MSRYLRSMLFFAVLAPLPISSNAAAFLYRCQLALAAKNSVTQTDTIRHRIPTNLYYIPSNDFRGDGSAKEHRNKTLTSSTLVTTASIAATKEEEDSVGPLSLHQQAAALRAEARSLERDLRSSIEAKHQKELADIDRWIEQCLYVSVPERGSDDDDGAVATVELLNDVETTTQILRDERYSPEQVQKMFQRISDTTTSNSRSNCSPLLALLVDAAGKLDTVDRQDNPNKRWNGRVERDLRKQLFAMDWGIDLAPEKNDNTRFL